MAETASHDDRADIISLRNTDLEGEDLTHFKEVLFDQPELFRDLLKIADFVQHLSRVLRGPRYYDDMPENDVEHSYMVALCALQIAEKSYPHLDRFKIVIYSLLHDAIEKITGDIITYNISEADRKAKEDRERDAVEQLMRELPKHIARLVYAYELQNDEESRFVRMVDKIMPPLVDIVGQGSRLVYDQYNETTVEGLQASHERSLQSYSQRFTEHPDLHSLYDLVAKTFEFKFSRELSKMKQVFGLGKTALDTIQ